MRAALLTCALAALLAACGDDAGSTDDARTIDASVSVDAALPDAGAVDAAAAGACIERSTDLPLPPTGALSCDLLPPGAGAP